MALRDHAPTLIARFRAGDTLQAIATDYGCTRERVRQILVLAGETGRRGGTSAPQKGGAERCHMRAIQAFGCDVATVRRLDDVFSILAMGRLSNAYLAQRAGARRRGIEWKFTFADWVGAWLKSGRLHERGRGKDRYVMARFHDAGGYEPSNVYFTTTGGNVSDYFAMRRALKVAA